MPRNLEEETQHEERKYSENLTGQAGHTISDIGNRPPGRADVAWDWNITAQVGLGPVI